MDEMVSIIVPVYNVQRYLLDCLDSIRGQTYQKWECYLIDDGSTDESGKICDDYADKDQRFKVIHKANGGVSSARNLALKNIGGGYLIFVDSDDVIDSQFIEMAVKKMNDNDVDVIQFGYTRDADELGKDRDSADRFLSLNDIANDTLRFQIVQPMLWAKMYRVESVQSLPFIDGCNTLEDVEWLTRVMQNRSFICSDYIGYYYRVTPGSAITQGLNIRKLNESIISHNACIETLKRGPYKDRSYNFKYTSLFNWLIRTSRKDGWIDYYRIVCRETRRDLLPMLLCQELSMKTKGVLLFNLLSPQVAHAVCAGKIQED